MGKAMTDTLNEVNRVLQAETVSEIRELKEALNREREKVGIAVDGLKLCVGEENCICEGGYAHQTKNKIIHKNYCQSVREAIAKIESEK